MTLIAKLEDKKHRKVIDIRQIARKNQKTKPKKPKNFRTSKYTLKMRSE